MASFRCMVALIAAVVGSSVVIADVAPAFAAEGKSSKGNRRGGYSYDQAEVINTYGDSRGRYGSSDSLRDPQLGRQTEGGPFDHGFFFDSGVGRNGGDAPYMR
ncbi:MAG: hypothetical protein Q7T86_06165 [Hyphomicrobiaceae bacterium]|jgi:hypothetical protein|nr:hypothetical protein [Hyphomicrobiaceae bacterium]